MTDLLTTFVIICAPIRVAHMLMGLPAARARRRRIQKFYQSNEPREAPDDPGDYEGYEGWRAAQRRR